MQIPARLSLAAILPAIMLGALASAASAETAAQRAACTPSVLLLCPAAAAAGDREAAKTCLLKNLARASRRCQAAVRAGDPPPPDATNPRSHSSDIQR
ncbi:MAG TPA: hypothetical protein VN694_16150 [Caulobacteraceae bacterium]|nr:hypothetical protein [Caulobacteraceae bacterium]